MNMIAKGNNCHENNYICNHYEYTYCNEPEKERQKLSLIQPDQNLCKWYSDLKDRFREVKEKQSANQSGNGDYDANKISSKREGGSTIPCKVTNVKLVKPSLYKEKYADASKRTSPSLKVLLDKYSSLHTNRPIKLFPRNVLRRLDLVESRFPNASQFVQLVREAVALSMLSNKGPIKIEPILLAGEPGIGKTAVVEYISAALNLPVSRLHVGAMQESFYLSGLHTSYVGAQPGAIASELNKIASANNIFLLDELDKGGTSSEQPSIYAPLHQLLESDTSGIFRDECLELDINTSCSTWFATANELDRIPASLISRFSVIEIKSPDQEQMPVVVDSIYRNMLKKSSWGGSFNTPLSISIIDKLSASGDCRSIKRSLRTAFGRAALRALDKKQPVQIRSSDIEINSAKKQRGIGFVMDM
jgi:DNA polymerase III delta prime subunit